MAFISSYRFVFLSFPFPSKLDSVAISLLSLTMICALYKEPVVVAVVFPSSAGRFQRLESLLPDWVHYSGYSNTRFQKTPGVRFL